MDADVLKIVGQVAGIGGLALGVFLLLFRDIIRKNIFPKLPPAEAYRLLRLITLAVWSLAIVGNRRLGLHWPEFATTLANLGALYVVTQRYAEATAALMEAADIRRSRTAKARRMP
jgi:hypothetical protein